MFCLIISTLHFTLGWQKGPERTKRAVFWEMAGANKTSGFLGNGRYEYVLSEQSQRSSGNVDIISFGTMDIFTW